MIPDDQGNNPGPAYPPCTLNSARYIHTEDTTNTVQWYPGYAQIMKHAQQWALQQGDTPKYNKIDWRSAKYDGTVAKLHNWEQTVDALVKFNNIPRELPSTYDEQVTHGIAAQFTGVAADAWSKEANKPKQIHTINNQEDLIEWARKKFLSTAYVEEKAKEVYRSRWNPSKDSLTVYNDKFKVLIAEANLQGSDDNSRSDGT